MNELQDVFHEFAGVYTADIVGNPDLLVKASNALLNDVANYLRYHLRYVSPDEFEKLKMSQENFAFIANLLAFILKKTEVFEDVKK